MKRIKRKTIKPTKLKFEPEKQNNKTNIKITTIIQT